MVGSGTGMFQLSLFEKEIHIMILDSEKCSSNLSCTANVCPLDRDIALRSHIPGDKVCHWFLDHLEGKPTPFDEEILANKSIMQEKYGLNNLARRVAGREKLRNVVWNVRTDPETSGETGKIDM
jgi:hypothetical protein